MTRAKEEGETPIDDTSGLRVKVKTRKELGAWEFKNNNEAHAKYLLRRLSDRNAPFTPTFLCRVHQDMFGKVWDWGGELRRSEKNLEVAAHKIGFELNRFVYDLHKWEEGGMSPIEIATRTHHRLVAIHPFETGNGRWARMIANIYLHKKNLPAMEWPKDPNFVTKIFRPKYLSALKAADRGDYEPLLRIHQEYWKESRE